MNWLHDPQLKQAADELASELMKRDVRIVFAESCTAGLVSAAMGTVPGISAYLCGSAVTYQIATKMQWLNPDFRIDDENVVSRKTAESMARQILELTPQADVAAAITGHLGPNAEPEELDGIAWIAVARREDEVKSQQIRLLETNAEESADPRELRMARQSQAAVTLLRFSASFLAGRES